MHDLAIRTEDLTKSFGEIRALAGLDLEVARGEIFGLVGPDGAGKTTTMRLLSGLLRPDAGRAEVAGLDVVERTEDVRRLLGYLPQTFAMLHELTVAENIEYFADLYCIPRGQFAQRSDELLSATGLTEFTGRRADALSGGMGQKLALICSLIHRPQVLLLDEPTRGVDPVSRRDLWRIVYGLPAEGVTVLISTPYADEAERCNRLGVLVDGILQTVGTPQDLVARQTSRPIELQATEQRLARNALEELDGVETVAVVGQALRITVRRDGPGPEELTKALDGAGVEATEAHWAQPRLADALLAIAERGGKDG